MLRAVPRRSGSVRHWFFRSVAVLAALVVAALIVGGWYSRPPRPDAFYDAPAGIPSSPGVLLRHKPFTRGLPAFGATSSDAPHRRHQGGSVFCR